ncbi:MAG: beta-lactamase family protein [Rhodospirillaceae bacterium]|nr:beta-lactamase family protein [Rhodospirillaceae bacterium]
MRQLARWVALCTVAAPLTAVAADIDPLFKAFGAETPGCAVGLAQDGRPPTLRAYGSADLEHKVANTPETVFEAGSVSKQFTASSVLMLAEEGKLALTDDIRKYLPEMPDYGTPITINHLLSHTSGLRDWGAVSALGGWPRTSAIHTNLDVLHIAARQRALNYPPGSAYSYTNTGYNLAAVIVERVSGKSLAAFSRERIFIPLGMNRTSWRDDFRRVVPNRAIAYDAKNAEGFSQDMPFEDAYGNGGLLTTVGDLLTWNAALTARKLGAFVTDHLEEQAVLTDGRKIAYARGLVRGTFNGVPEIVHSGSTAGYRAWIGRFPSQKVSVAVLCNVASANATRLARDAAVQVLTFKAAAAVKPSAVAADEQVQLPGTYIDERMGASIRILAREGVLKIAPAAPDSKRETDLVRLAARRYGDGGAEITFTTGGAERRTADGEVSVYRKVEPYAPAAAELGALTGRYASTEADATLIATLNGGRLVLTPANRPSAPSTLIPLARDIYLEDDGLTTVVRGPGGQVEGLRFIRPRVYNLVFYRTQD